MQIKHKILSVELSNGVVSLLLSIVTLLNFTYAWFRVPYTKNSTSPTLSAIMFEGVGSVNSDKSQVKWISGKNEL